MIYICQSGVSFPILIRSGIEVLSTLPLAELDDDPWTALVRRRARPATAAGSLDLVDLVSINAMVVPSEN